ncbi:ShlB/FhaC/HecB family hemolysin secretion/activation protein [Rahnella sp. AA]|nr:POTRA domain-containing protein [Rahnella sp. AA]PKE29756.1 ShlB/FhaC/HecB family hemolysin secretion/activation protein [Rahnella sp. AA]
MRIKSCIVALLGSAIGYSSADMFPTLIDPNNPARLAQPISQPPVKSQKIDLPAQKSAPDLTPQTLIDVKHIQFVGGTQYPLDSLAAPFAPFVGKKVPLSQLLAATDEITRRYHKDGFVLSYAYIPADNFKDGVVKIGLVEGYISGTQIHSDNQQVGRWLSKLSQHIMADKPLTQDTFERYTILMERTPDTKVTASANNPDNIYGATVLNVQALRPRNWNIQTAVDTRKGDSSAVVNATLSGLSTYGEQLGIATLIPLESGTRKTYAGLNYQQYLGDDGLLMQLKGSYYQQKDKDYNTILSLPNGITVGSQNTQTQYNGGVVFSYPLELTRKKQWTISGELDYLDKKYDYDLWAKLGNQQIQLPSVNQRVRYPAAELSLNGYREYDQAYWSTKFNVRQGIDGLGATNSTPNADLSFTRWKFNGDAAYLFDKKWRLSTSVEGDWSDNDLPEPERVNFGALHYGRGYPDSDAQGDYGVGGQVELRYIHNLEQGDWLKTIQPYAVIDGAHTEFNQAGLPKQNLSSYALGVMFGDNRHYTLSVEAARPIGDVPLDSNSRDWRYNATFTYNFSAGS